MTNGLGNVTAYAFDAAGNMLSTADPLNHVTAYGYDEMNRLLTTARPDGSVSTNAYDALGRLVSRTGAGSIPVSYEYDSAGRMTKLIDGEENETAFEYDSLGRLVTKTYADGSFYSYGYSPRGWLTNRVDAMSKATGYQYNDVGQLTTVDYATDTDVIYGYNNLGRQTGRVDAAGTWAWSYDAESSRVLSESVSSLPSRPSVQYSYAPDTYELASVACGGSTTLYAWAAGRLTNVTALAATGSPLAFSYAYKAGSDLLETTTYFGGTVLVSRAYDNADRLLAVTNDFGSGGKAFNYALDSAGRRTSRSDQEKVSGLWSAVSGLTWGYDSCDQLTSGAKTDPANPAPAAAYNYAYQYDEVGNRLHEDRGPFGLDGTFNPLNQLTHRDWSGKLDVYGTIASTNPPVTNWVNGVTSTLYTDVSPTQFLGGAALQAGSNVISIVTADAAGPNETLRTVYMPPAKPQEFTYDLNGNLTNDGWRVYTWNEENRLVKTESLASVPDAAKVKVENLYDYMGRRVRKTVSSDYSGGSYTTTNVTTYVWDGFNIIAEMCDAGYTNWYTYGLDLSGTLQGAGGVGGALAMTRDTGTATNTYLYCFDGNGNVVNLVDASDGSIAATYEYSPFGSLIRSTGDMASDNPVRWSTKHTDDETGLVMYELRPYSPTLGRFISRDPRQELGSLSSISRALLVGILSNRRSPLVMSADVSPYCFVQNSPTIFFDYLGLFAVGGPPSYPTPPGYTPTPGNPVSPVYPYPITDDCVCPAGSNEGHRPKDDWDPYDNDATDKECTTQILEMVPGAGGWLFQYFSSVFDECCKHHDACYATCNEPKDSCDNDFADCMGNKCESSYSGWMQDVCTAMAAIYYQGVDWFGDSPAAAITGQSYSQLQDAACEDCCCP